MKLDRSVGVEAANDAANDDAAVFTRVVPAPCRVEESLAERLEDEIFRFDSPRQRGEFGAFDVVDQRRARIPTAGVWRSKTRLAISGIIGVVQATRQGPTDLVRDNDTRGRAVIVLVLAWSALCG